MKKKKSLRILLKRKLHPLLSYAVLFGVGAMAISTTGTIAGANLSEPVSLPARVTADAPRPAPSADLGKLKAAASEFANQLAVIKAQIAELEKYGRTPPPALIDAIGEGDQLVALIANAPTLADIGFDGAAKLQSIGATIAANSKF